MPTEQNQQQNKKPDMTVHAGEGMDIAGVAAIIAMCYDGGGWVQAILFTGNKVTPTMDPKVMCSEGVYSAIWMLPKEPDEKDNGKANALKIADAGKE